MFLPYKCKYCGGTFCSEHRLPENHNCPGIQYWNVPVKVKKEPRVGGLAILSFGANNLVIITCLVLFFISILVPEFTIRYLALHPSIPILISMPWQFLTSIFLHLGFWHFFVNTFVLLFFGGELERRLGSRRYLELFLLSGIAGNFGYVVYANLISSSSPALGASAAVFGVMGCLAIIAPEIRMIIFPFPIPINIRAALILFAIYDFWMMIANSIGVFSTNVANIAHLAGLAIGVYYGRKIRKYSHRYDR